jgi:hypothetical protein
MKKTILLALLLASSAASLCSAESVYVPLPKGDRLFLPLQVGVTNSMIYAPKAKPIDHPNGMIFLVDDDGHPWLSNEGKFLINLLGNSLLMVDKKYHDASIFDDGEVVLCTDEAMGTLDSPSPEEKKRNKFLMKFHPRVALPYKNMRVYAGEGNAIYAVGKNPDDGKDELFITAAGADGKKTFVKLVAIKEGISAVAGDGKTTYFSSGSLIVKIGPDHKKMERVIKLAGDPIKELAYSSKAGLFYANDKGVAYVGEKKPILLLSAPDISMRLRKNSLLILFVKEQEVMEFAGIEGFSKLFGRK